MGADEQRGTTQAQKPSSTSNVIVDKYKTYAELEQAIRQAGIESMQCVMGFDFSKSNEWTGDRTYGKRSLHDLTFKNPYLHCIEVMTPLIPKFDDD